MTYTREQIEGTLAAHVEWYGAETRIAGMIRQLLDENAAMREDKARLDWLESSRESHGICHSGNGDYRHYALQIAGYPSVREVLDAARGKP